MPQVSIPTTLRFDNSYAKQLDGFYTLWDGAIAPDPVLRCLNRPLAADLGLETQHTSDNQLAQVFSGSVAPTGATPLAQVYAGHQFGGFSPQLGDGRALLLGEVRNQAGERLDIALKGSGRTPYSRGGDGKAVLGPVLREYLIAEAMFALKIPTTRALAVVTTGEQVMREDGPLPGAVLTRVAASHLRVGTFQFFAARGETDRVRRLADYAIARHYPAVQEQENPYLALLESVSRRQAALVAKWMGVGFVHGVMNTDNMTISGETIDYGPCAFIDTYDPAALFSSIDRQGRYAFGQQPVMARWNLARFAETLLPLIDPDETRAIELASAEVNAFGATYMAEWTGVMAAKTGLQTKHKGDTALVDGLMAAMEGQNVDYTLFFQDLITAVSGDTSAARARFDDPQTFDIWAAKWQNRLQQEGNPAAGIQAAMKQENPVYIPRNHMVEAALDAAQNGGDYGPFEQLTQVLANPFERRTGLEEYEQPAPKDALPYRTFCGT